MKKATGITSKITRRKLADAIISFSGLLSGAVWSSGLAQTPAPADPLQAAKDRVKTAGDALAKEQVPMATEPAFQFKA
jgi:hypothetical protein